MSDFDREYDRGPNPIEIVRRLVSAATEFVKGLVGIKNEARWKAQSGGLARAASSGVMNYEDFFKVIVQLADVTQSYKMLNTRDNSADGVVSNLARMRERFAAPADLTD